MNVGKEKTTFNYRNLKTSNLRQCELINYSANINLGYGISKLFCDSLEKEVYTVLTSNVADYYLFELFKEGSPINPKGYKIFHYELYESLQDTAIEIKRTKFFSFIVNNEQKDFCKIEQHKDGYRLSFAPGILDSLVYQAVLRIENDKYHKLIAQEITKSLNIPFSSIDLYEMVQFFLRNSYYQKLIFSQPDYNLKGFIEAKIVGRIDTNQDGEKEFLINVSGDRWISNLIICYDKTTQKIVWKKEFASKLQVFVISDIDKDGIEEILVSTYSPCNELAIDWLRKKEIGLKNHSSFYILNNKGEIKNINGKQAVVKSSPGFYQFYYLPLLEQNKVLLGLYSKYDNSDKNLLLFDLNNNEIDTLNIVYQHIIGIYKENENIVALNLFENELQKIIISEKFKVKKIIRKKVDKEYGTELPYHHKIEDKEYNIIYPFTILSKKLKFLYQSPYYIMSSSIYFKDNDLYFITKRNDANYLSKLHFERNKTINPYVIMILFIEIFLLITYFFVHQFIAIPLTSGLKSYLIVYSLFNKLHFWKIYGKMKRIYTLPKRISFDTNTYTQIVNDLSREKKEIYKKNFLLFNYRVYELESMDELLIIQRIAHDLKNQILLMKMMVSQKDKMRVDDEELKSILANISQMSVTLSQFSHIKTLYREDCDLIKIIEQTISQYINHPLFDLIEFNHDVSDSMIKIDKTLFQIMLRNLFNNALENIDENGYIIVQLSDSKNKFYLEISNPGDIQENDILKLFEIGYSTQEDGSGIGIPISKMIVERHNGTIDISSKNSEVKVSIILPKN